MKGALIMFMKKFSALMVALVVMSMFAVPAFADKYQVTNSIVYASDGSTTDIPVGGETIAYTKYFELKNFKHFAVWLKATSSGTVNFKVELEQGETKPTTEGAADANWCVNPDVGEVIAAVTDTNAHKLPTYPVEGKYGRYKITELSGNDASTTVEMINSMQY